jgi:hypothetical protein
MNHKPSVMERPGAFFGSRSLVWVSEPVKEKDNADRYDQTATTNDNPISAVK